MSPCLRAASSRFWAAGLRGGWLGGAVTLGLALASVGRSLSAAEPSSRELAAYFEPDHVARATLSPDGRRLAYAVYRGAVLSINTIETAAGENKTVVYADVGLASGVFSRTVLAPVDVLFLGWADNATLVYGISVPRKGADRREELHAYDVATRSDRRLLRESDVEGFYDAPAPPLGGHEATDEPRVETVYVPRPLRVIGFVGDGASILIQANGTNRVATRVVRVDLRTGGQQRVTEEDGDVRLLCDWNGNVRVRETRRVSGDRPPEFIPGAPRSRVPRSAPLPVRQWFELNEPGRHGWRRLDEIRSGMKFSHDDAELFAPRSFPLAFDRDPAVLYVASAVGRDTYGIYALNTTTGQCTALAVPATDHDLVAPTDVFSSAALVFDRHHQLAGVRIPGAHPTTWWRDPAFTQWQRELEERFPNRDVRILEWSDAGTNALVLVAGGSEPGRYFIAAAAAPTALVEVLRQSTKLSAERQATVVPVDDLAPGHAVRGRVTLPLDPRVIPPPLVVLCRDLPHPAASTSGYDQQAQALAACGFMVLEVDHRGVSGLGAAHQAGLREGIARAPLEDIDRALDWLAAAHPYDRRRVAWVGGGFGGYLVLKALAARPSGIRCAVVVNAPTELASWWGSGDAFDRLNGTFAARRALVGKDADRLAAAAGPLVFPPRLPPVLVIQDSKGARTAADSARLRQLLERADSALEWIELPGGRVPSQPEDAARLFKRIAGFLNANLFSYRVDVGPEQEVK